MIADAAAEADTDLVPMDVDAPLRPVEGMLPMHRMRQRVAAIDCGTNSIRLLVADLSLTPAGPLLVDVHREMRVVRLGEGVDATGVLAGSALDRTWHALADYAAIIRASGADAIRMVATSATRDAANRDEFVAMVTGTLKQPPEVISGEEEAELTFHGAVGDLSPTDGPFLVVDIGGGSTEIVLGTVPTSNPTPDLPGSIPVDSHDVPDRYGGAAAPGSRDNLPDGRPEIVGSVSLAIGCVRITERILRSDPPTREETSAAQDWTTSSLRPGLARLPIARARTLVAVSGTATTVAAAALRLPVYDPVRIHLTRVGVAEARRISEFLQGATRAHRAALGYMHPGRVDVIGGGSMILATVAELVAAHSSIRDFVASEHDILDGIALSMA